MTDVQQVMTQSRGKVADWETQEAIRKKATEWIKKANEHNMAEIEDPNAQPEEAVKHTEDNPTWQALQEIQCQIVLPLAHLLQLVPRFTADLQATVIKPKPAPALVFFSNPEEGPIVVDTSSPTCTVIVKGKEIAGKIIDRGSGVNFISKRTCDTLGIREWEPCPFWLRMANTSSI